MLLILHILVVVLADHREQLWLRLANIVDKPNVLTMFEQPVNDKSDVLEV